MSALERLKALDEQRAQLLEGAKREALERARNAIAELKELGFDYALIERSRDPLMQGQRREQFETEAPKRQAIDVACPICGIITFPRHDGRAHWHQDPKRPFIAEELAEAGFTTVGPLPSLLDDTLPGS